MNEKIEFEETKRCLLCVRIPFERIVDITSKLYSDPKIQYQVAEYASKLIQRKYNKNKTALCGKSPKVIMGGAIYLSAVINGEFKTQRIIGDTIKISEPALRLSYPRFANILTEEELKKIENNFYKPYKSSYSDFFYSHTPAINSILSSLKRARNEL